MTFDFRKFSPPSILALSLGKDSLTATSIRRGGEQPESSPVSVPIAADAILGDPAKAGAALAAALAAANLNGFRSAVCVPPSWVLSTTADLPEVGAEDLHGYFELRAEREFSLPDLLLSHDTYEIPGPGPATRRATLAAISAKRMESIHAFLKAAGCNPVSISLDLPGCFASGSPALHLLCGGDLVDIIVSFGGGIAAMRSISSDPGTLARELRITLGRLPESVRGGLKAARISGPHDTALSGVLEKLGLSPVIEKSPEPGAAAQESARRTLNHIPVAFEFFTPEPNRWEGALKRVNTRRGRRAAAAAAALVFLPVLVFSYRSHEETRLNREWEGMSDTVAELDSIQQKIRQFRPWFETTPQKLQVLKAVVNAFPERGDLWTRSVQITPYVGKTESGSHGTPSSTASTVTVNAFSLNNTAMMSMQGALSKQAGVSELQLKQLRGNNPIQFSLTFKWEPRHD